MGCTSRAARLPRTRDKRTEGALSPFKTTGRNRTFRIHLQRGSSHDGTSRSWKAAQTFEGRVLVEAHAALIICIYRWKSTLEIAASLYVHIYVSTAPHGMGVGGVSAACPQRREFQTLEREYW